MRAVLWDSRGDQESCGGLQLRGCAPIPYTESRSAEVGDFVADMEVHGTPSLETGRTDFLLIFCRRVRDGRGRWSGHGDEVRVRGEHARRLVRKQLHNDDA